MAELQNANPTIINLSELPTRRRQRQAQRRPDDDLVSFSPRPPHWEKLLHETFEGFESKSVSDSSDVEDPIDEQEIFGTCQFSYEFLCRPRPLGAISAMRLHPCALLQLRHAIPRANKSCRFCFMAFPVAAHLAVPVPRCCQHPGSAASGFMGPLAILLLRFGFISP